MRLSFMAKRLFNIKNHLIFPKYFRFAVSPTNQLEPTELNAWRRGFTPQAEIWNGRLAMLGLSVGIGVLVLWRLIATT